MEHGDIGTVDGIHPTDDNWMSLVEFKSEYGDGYPWLVDSFELYVEDICTEKPPISKEEYPQISLSPPLEEPLKELWLNCGYCGHTCNVDKPQYGQELRCPLCGDSQLFKITKARYDTFDIFGYEKH